MFSPQVPTPVGPVVSHQTYPTTPMVIYSTTLLYHIQHTTVSTHFWSQLYRNLQTNVRLFFSFSFQRRALLTFLSFSQGQCIMNLPFSLLYPIIQVSTHNLYGHIWKCFWIDAALSRFFFAYSNKNSLTLDSAGRRVAVHTLLQKTSTILHINTFKFNLIILHTELHVVCYTICHKANVIFMWCTEGFPVCSLKASLLTFISFLWPSQLFLFTV